MADPAVLSELKDSVVPHWAARLEKYLPKEDDAPSSGLLITPAQLSRPADQASCSGSSTKRIGEKPMVLIGPETYQDETTQLTPDFPSPRIQPGRGGLDDKKTNSKEKLVTAPHGLCKLESKPEPTKSRFSSITGPTVWYDGESQAMLNDLWTAMNNKRGGLRKEMMMLKRRQQPSMSASMKRPVPVFSIPMSASDDEEEDDKKEEKDDEEEENSAEMLKLRLKMDREKMKRMNRRGPPQPMPSSVSAGAGAGVGLAYKRARMGPPPPPASPETTESKPSFDEEKYKQLLEAIDENLDKACKVTETAAFIWLKGDAYAGHLKFILAKLRDIAVRVEASGFLPPKEEPAAAKKEGEDEDTVMGPPPPPQVQNRKIAEAVVKRKSDVTMRDAEPLMAAASISSPPPPPQSQSEKQYAPVVAMTQQDTPMRNSGDDKMSVVEPAVVEVGIEVDDRIR